MTLRARGHALPQHDAQVAALGRGLMQESAAQADYVGAAYWLNASTSEFGSLSARLVRPLRVRSCVSILSARKSALVIAGRSLTAQWRQAGWARGVLGFGGVLHEGGSRCIRPGASGTAPAHDFGCGKGASRPASSRQSLSILPKDEARTLRTKVEDSPSVCLRTV